MIIWDIIETLWQLFLDRARLIYALGQAKHSQFSLCSFNAAGRIFGHGSIRMSSTMCLNSNHVKIIQNYLRYGIQLLWTIRHDQEVVVPSGVFLQNWLKKQWKMRPFVHLSTRSRCLSFQYFGFLWAFFQFVSSAQLVKVNEPALVIDRHVRLKQSLDLPHVTLEDLKARPSAHGMFIQFLSSWELKKEESGGPPPREFPSWLGEGAAIQSMGFQHKCSLWKTQYELFSFGLHLPPF